MLGSNWSHSTRAAPGPPPVPDRGARDRRRGHRAPELRGDRPQAAHPRRQVRHLPARRRLGLPVPEGHDLWTKLGQAKRTSRLELQVAKDRHFKNVVLEKTVTARKERDFTAAPASAASSPAHEYFYRFHTKDKGSPVGRFRTAPPHDSKRPLRIAFLSCQSYEAGFYNAHAAIAKEPDIDFVLHLGDYIYESITTPARARTPPASTTTETSSTCPSTGRSTTSTRATATCRRCTPPTTSCRSGTTTRSRTTTPTGSPARTPSRASPTTATRAASRSRSARQRLPGLLQLHAADPLRRRTGPRLRARPDRQARRPDRHRRAPVPRPAALQRRPAVTCPDQQNPNRTMLGIQQKSWFKQTLATSPQTWKLWANEVMLMGFQPAPRTASTTTSGTATPRSAGSSSSSPRQQRQEPGPAHRRHPQLLHRHRHHRWERHRHAGCGEFVGGSATSHGLPEETGLRPGDQGADQRPRQAHQLHGPREPGLRDPRGHSEPGHLRVQAGPDPDPRRRPGDEHGKVRPGQRLDGPPAGLLGRRR